MARYIAILTMMVVVSCASIPPQAPALSEELGNKISSLEKSHLNLLHLYFEQKRNTVDEFIRNVWIPEFTKNFFKHPEIEPEWERIAKSVDSKERYEFFVAVGGALQSEIDSKRQQLMTPLDGMEQELEEYIRDEFNLARGASNTLTSFLSTASKVDENRGRYMKMLNISDDKISSIMNKTDKVLSDLVANTDKVIGKSEELEKRSSEYLEKLKQLKEELSKK